MAADAPISPALAAALAAGRSHFNARTAEAKHRQPSFDTAGFAAFIRVALGAVADSVAATTPARTLAAILAGYDIALALVAQGHAGPRARSDVVTRAWIALAPCYAKLIAAEPFEVLGALANAALNVNAAPGARVDEWIGGMADVAAHVSTRAEFSKVGQVVAWRAGLAHFRDGALRAAATLPDTLALRALGAGAASDWPTLAEAYGRSPWFSPDAKRQASAQAGVCVGAFAGFGGRFAAPPSVRAHSQGFMVQSADRFSLLMADAYGAVLLPATAEEFARADSFPHDAKIHGTDVVQQRRTIATGLPAAGLALTANAHTVAVSSPYTHAVLLLPRV